MIQLFLFLNIIFTLFKTYSCNIKHVYYLNYTPCNITENRRNIYVFLSKIYEDTNSTEDGYEVLSNIDSLDEISSPKVECVKVINTDVSCVSNSEQSECGFNVYLTDTMYSGNYKAKYIYYHYNKYISFDNSSNTSCKQEFYLKNSNLKCNLSFTGSSSVYSFIISNTTYYPYHTQLLTGDKKRISLNQLNTIYFYYPSNPQFENFSYYMGYYLKDHPDHPFIGPYLADVNDSMNESDIIRNKIKNTAEYIENFENFSEVFTYFDYNNSVRNNTDDSINKYYDENIYLSEFKVNTNKEYVRIHYKDTLVYDYFKNTKKLVKTKFVYQICSALMDVNDDIKLVDYSMSHTKYLVLHVIFLFTSTTLFLL